MIMIRRLWNIFVLTCVPSVMQAFSCPQLHRWEKHSGTFYKQIPFEVIISQDAPAIETTTVTVADKIVPVQRVFFYKNGGSKDIMTAIGKFHFPPKPLYSISDEDEAGFEALGNDKSTEKSWYPICDYHVEITDCE